MPEVTGLLLSRNLKILGVFDWNSQYHWIEDNNGWRLVEKKEWEWSCDTYSHFNSCSAFTAEELAKLIKEKEKKGLNP